MTFLKSDHYIIDFRKNTKEHVGTFYATKEVEVQNARILLASPGPAQPAIMKLEGQDLLGFKTYIEGNKSPITTGRFLNSEYEEMIFESDLPDKGLNIEGVLSKISDKLFVSTKTVKNKSTGEKAAVIQEIISIIDKDEYEKAT
ncbi:hypothetical protein ACLVWU_10660 [Bdellovibrio sp. HCB290]|uniref:hypothetical protein n=1 Tax=Bdellovibrio sp. HCB290 TaxID=3394356 RepID=UPI0039B44B86